MVQNAKNHRRRINSTIHWKNHRSKVSGHRSIEFRLKERTQHKGRGRRNSKTGS
ncbi:hypothetical protein Syun_010163 [Stephania yunnanensis]|uniref:Uncharacterized protein n=1 Tax=Stephania yunnanensis TaxID=152371 RepID=A0AAP0PRE0_9MAGN